MKDTLTVWHAVMDWGTVTFLTYDSLKEFLSPASVDEIQRTIVVCESEISQEDYQRLSAMRGEV